MAQEKTIVYTHDDVLSMMGTFHNLQINIDLCMCKLTPIELLTEFLNNNNMAQDSSVKWLIEKLRQLAHNPKTHLGMGNLRVTQGYLDDIEEQAKEMHKVTLTDELIGFQIFLNEKGYITDYDWDFEKVAKQYVKKTYKK